MPYVLQVLIVVAALLACVSAGVINSGWSSGWPSYGRQFLKSTVIRNNQNLFKFLKGSGWNYGGGYAHAPVKVVKVVAAPAWPSSGWSSGGWPSSGWSSGTIFFAIISLYVRSTINLICSC